MKNYRIRNIILLLRRAVCLTIIMLLITTTSALAVDIVIDGGFDDWIGQPYIPDPNNDASDPRGEIIAFYYTTNPNDETVYMMLQRQPDISKITYEVYVDTSCENGIFDSIDKTINIQYFPRPQGNVTMNMGIGKGDRHNEGGARVEVGVPFSDLGINPNQTICMYAKSFNPTNMDLWDTTDTVQWSPVPALGYPLLIAFVVVAIGIVIWKRKAIFQWKHK